jgi:methylphosphotriester-DNA--protein-cysteine methyltransferase
MFHGEIDSAEFKKSVHAGSILFAGNKKLRIYGTLRCASGKRMKKKNRVFFASEDEAIKQGFRPCAHCMRKQYQRWLSNPSQNSDLNA